MKPVKHLEKAYWLKFVIAIALVILIVNSIDINITSAYKAIKNYKLLVIAIVFPLLINPVISNLRWNLFLKVQGINESFLSLVKVTFVSAFFGILLPSSTGFDAIRVIIIEKRNRQKSGKGGVSVIFERLLGLFILTTIGEIGAVFSLSHGVSKNIFISILCVNLFVTLVIFICKNHFFYSKLNKLLSKIKKPNRFVIFIISLYTSLYDFPLNKVLLKVLPFVILFQISGILCGFLIFRAFNIDIPFFYFLAFLPLISIISVIPISISGIGLREGGFIYFFGLLGVDSNICFLSSIIYYFLLMVIPALIGFLIYFFGKDHFQTQLKMN